MQQQLWINIQAVTESTKGYITIRIITKTIKTVSTINTVLLGRFVNIQEVVTAVTKYSFGENFDHGFTVDIAYQQKW